jgi:hypothetical protein
MCQISSIQIEGIQILIATSTMFLGFSKGAPSSTLQRTIANRRQPDQRQQRTIRSAYYFTNMLLYRGFLLHDFMTRVPGLPVSVPSELGQKCRDAAISMAEFASEFANDDTYNPVFWVSFRIPFTWFSVLTYS